MRYLILILSLLTMSCSAKVETKYITKIKSIDVPDGLLDQSSKPELRGNKNKDLINLIYDYESIRQKDNANKYAIKKIIINNDTINSNTLSE